MKKISFILLLFVFVVFQNFACQQKKATEQVSKKLNDSTPISPNTMGPEAVDKTPSKTERKDTVPRGKMMISEMQAQVLSEGTQIGKPGDMLLTFIGRGFLFTENNPVLMIAGSKFENTYSNEDATEFYVVIPAESKEKLIAVATRGLQIINPDNESVAFKDDGATIMKRAGEASKVKLMYTKFAVERKPANK